MEIPTTYSVKIKESNKAFQDTAEKYRGAVAFFLGVALLEWDKFVQAKSDCQYNNALVGPMEKLTIVTKNRPSVP